MSNDETKDFFDYIVGTEKIIKWFGYWPSFHDAEVLWIKLDRGNERMQGDTRIEFVVHAWEINFNVPEGMPFPKQCLVHFIFRNCANIHLTDFNQQNQLYTIEISVEQQPPVINNIVSVNAVVKILDHEQSLPEKVLKIVFDSAFGLEGEFFCSSGEIASIIACDEDGVPLESKS